VAARAFVRGLLARLVGTSPRALVFEAGAHGKPSLARAHDLQFNLSRSGPLAVCAVARGRDAVGVDVERVRAMDDLDRVAHTVFSARELERYLQLPDDRRTPAFFEAWTRKEAVLKAAGSGLARSPQEVETLVALSDPDQAAAADGHDAWIHAFEPCAGYVGALAVSGPLRDVRIHDWHWA
jgi:4'-phosphopantetheinyl transferase